MNWCLLDCCGSDDHVIDAVQPSSNSTIKKIRSKENVSSMMSIHTETTVSFDQDDSVVLHKEESLLSSSRSTAQVNDTPDSIVLHKEESLPPRSQSTAQANETPGSIVLCKKKSLLSRSRSTAQTNQTPGSIVLRKNKSMPYSPGSTAQANETPDSIVLHKRESLPSSSRSENPDPVKEIDVSDSQPFATKSNTPLLDMHELRLLSTSRRKVAPQKDDFIEPVKAVIREKQRRVRAKPLNKNLIELAQLFPDATDEERSRFLDGKGGDIKKASKQLEVYLEWRRRYGIDSLVTPHVSSSSSADEWHSCASETISDDENDWKSSATAALSYDPNYQNCKVSDYPELPRLARFDDINGSDCMRGKNGNRIMQLTPAQLDIALTSEEIYALCLALYLDRQLSRTSTEKIIISIDVRTGKGWANPSARAIVPFIKAVIGVLETNFPERLGMAIVYPLPWTATAVWKVAKLFLDPNTAKKMVVIKGPADKDSKVPYDKMEPYIKRSVIDTMEKNRLSSFVDTKQRF